MSEQLQTMVSVQGALGDALAAGIAQLSSDTPYNEHLVAQDVVRDPGRPRIFEDYEGDLSGRYLDACAVAIDSGLPLDLAKAQRILGRVLDAQNPDGSFGRGAPVAHLDHGRAWGHGRLLAGLISARSFGECDRLDVAMRRLVSWIAATAPAWAAWLREPDNQNRKFALDCLSSVLPLVEYHRLTGDARAEEAASTLAAAFPAEAEGFHMHGYLLALRGIAELSQLKSSRTLLGEVVAAADRVAVLFLMPHGGVVESLAIPWDANTEACGIADWVMLCARLSELDAAPRHADRCEQSLFNALLHAQHDSGHFGCETRTADEGLLVTDYAPEAWWCCTFHGIRALRYISERAVRIREDSVDVWLPVASRAKAYLDSSPVDVVVQSDYPGAGLVEIAVWTDSDNVGRLRLRLPSTSTLSRVLVDGRPEDVELHQGWVVVPIAGSSSKVSIELKQQLSYLLDGERRFLPFANTTEKEQGLESRRCAVFSGPRLLAATTSVNTMEDILRARALEVADPLGVLEPDAQAAMRVWGHDTFECSLHLSPLADRDRRHHALPTRISFASLAFASPTIHGTDVNQTDSDGPTT